MGTQTLHTYVITTVPIQQFHLRSGKVLHQNKPSVVIEEEEEEEEEQQQQLLGAEPDYLPCVQMSCFSCVWTPYPNRVVWGGLHPHYSCRGV
jgi:hypothetical protein